jgi:hypothetical protein
VAVDLDAQLSRVLAPPRKEGVLLRCEHRRHARSGDDVLLAAVRLDLPRQCDVDVVSAERTGIEADLGSEPDETQCEVRELGGAELRLRDRGLVPRRS